MLRQPAHSNSQPPQIGARAGPSAKIIATIAMTFCAFMPSKASLTRAVYAQMKARGSGVIVNDIGAAGEAFDANHICACAGNAALMAFTRALGGKSLADNIRVVGINPGPVGTDRFVSIFKTRAMHQFGDENRYQEFQKGMPLGRPAHAREIGDLMAFLASDRAGYTSGVIYTVDGGLTAGWG